MPKTKSSHVDSKKSLEAWQPEEDKNIKGNLNPEEEKALLTLECQV